MAVNYIQPGERLVYSNSGDEDVISGTLLVIGALVGVADSDIPAGQSGTAGISGVWRLPKGAGAITQGAAVYAADGKISATSGGGTFAGVAFAAADSAAPTVDVLLNVGVGA